MKRFQDKENGQWSIDLTVGALLRVKEDSKGKFNLFEPEAPHGVLVPGEKPVPLRQALWQDDAEFWEVLWHIVEPDATKRSVDAKQFGELMAAKCLVDAKDAFYNEWREFFLQSRRIDRAAAMEKMIMYHGKALELVEAQLRDPQMAEIDQRVTTEMESKVRTLFGGLLASLGASTPSPTPGESLTK